MTANIVVDIESLDTAAGALRDVAADLAAGQFDLFLLDWAGPCCPTEMAKAIRAFAEYAHNRYRDTVAVTFQLSEHLALAATNYRHRDMALARQMLALAGFLPR